MVHVAREMTREGFDVPLLIGGRHDQQGPYGREDRAGIP